MARRRVNNSKRRREWRKARAEELAELRALWKDAVHTCHKWQRMLVDNITDIDYQNDLFRRLWDRQVRRYAAYQNGLNDR